MKDTMVESIDFWGVDSFGMEIGENTDASHYKTCADL